MFGDYPESNHAKQMVLAFFGHLIEDKDVLNVFKESKKLKKKSSILKSIKMGFGMFYILIFGPKNLIKCKTEYMDQLKYDMVEKVKHKRTAKDILYAITDEYSKMCMVQFKNHGPTSMGSSIKHMLLRNALEGAQSK